MMLAGVPPMEMLKLIASILACCTSWPAGMFGVTGPKPRPYRVMMSPGTAGREVSPAMAPTGRA